MDRRVTPGGLRSELMRLYGWTDEQVADIPDHLLQAVLDA